MQKNDLERFAFLFLCGKRDRKILLGKEKMTFEDFERLMYLTDLLGLEELNVEILNQHAVQFERNFEGLEALYETEEAISPDEAGSEDLQRRKEWIEAFASQTPYGIGKNYIKQILNRISIEQK